MIVMLAVAMSCIAMFVVGVWLGKSTKSKTYPIIVYDASKADQADVEIFTEDGFGTIGVSGDPREAVFIINQ